MINAKTLKKENEMNCQEILEKFMKIKKSLSRIDSEIENERAEMDEENYYDNGLMDKEIIKKEYEEELIKLVKLIESNNCEEHLSPEEYREIMILGEAFEDWY